MFLSHGFSEHLGLYQEVGTFLSKTHLFTLFFIALFFSSPFEDINKTFEIVKAMSTYLKGQGDEGFLAFGHDHIGHGSSGGK